MKITIYTDGAAKGNPGPGGYGVVMFSDTGHYKEMSEGFRKTTNNRMELLSIIVALRSIKKPGADVTIYSDSKYVVDSVEKGWLQGWIKKGFKGKKNVDLWKLFIEAYRMHNVKLKWVKGHAGNKYNERCDTLAVEAAELNTKQIDLEYEKQNAGQDLFNK